MLAVGAQGCSTTVRGEFSIEACSNGEDDDRDDRMDCEDPDCWVFCPLGPAGSLGDAASHLGPDGGPPGSTPWTPRTDASARMPPEGDEDAGTAVSGVEGDGGWSVPPPCSCASDEICIDERCHKRIDGQYELRVVSAFVPLYSAYDRCYDYTSSACVSRRPLVCECTLPDPYVVILLDRTPLRRAITPEARDNASPVWAGAPSETAAVTEDSRLELVVYDYDGLGSDTEIFRCAPDLSPLRTQAPGRDQPLSCNPVSGMTIAPPRNSNFFININAVKLDGAG